MTEMTDYELIMMLQQQVKESSLKETAKILNISPSYLHHIINHRRAPGKKVLTALGLAKINLYVDRVEV